MPWSDTMTVEVGYELDQEPTDDHFQSLRWGAEALTDDEDSIRIERSRNGDHHVVVVVFTMGKLAQHKVVGDIHQRFKISFNSHHDHRDSWIAFPKGAARSGRRRRR